MGLCIQIKVNIKGIRQRHISGTCIHAQHNLPGELSCKQQDVGDQLLALSSMHFICYSSLCRVIYVVVFHLLTEILNSEILAEIK